MKKQNFIVSLLVMITVLLPSCKKEREQQQNVEPQKKELKMKTIHLTKEEFAAKVMNYTSGSSEWKYLGDKPCIIDFYATWCGPCKALAPILDEIALKYDGKLYVYKVDVDEQADLATAFGIRSVPTLLFCPMTGDPQTTLGAMSKDKLKAIISEVLKVD